MYAENEREKFFWICRKFFTHVHFRSSPIENFISPVNWSLIHHRSHGPLSHPAGTSTPYLIVGYYPRSPIDPGCAHLAICT